MKKIKYNDISNDIDNLLMIIDKMITIYKKRQYHTQVLECNQWVMMLSRLQIQTEYTSEAILALKNILNDCANIYLAYGDFETGTIAMNLMNKLMSILNEK